MASASGEKEPIKVALVDIDGTLINNELVFRRLTGYVFDHLPFDTNINFSYNRSLINELKQFQNVFLVSDRELKTGITNLLSLNPSSEFLYS